MGPHAFRSVILASISAAVAFVVGCGKQQALRAPNIFVEVNGQAYNQSTGFIVDPGVVAEGQTLTLTVRVYNTGDGPLEVKEARLEYTPIAPSEAEDPAFSLTPPDLPATVAAAGSQSDLPSFLELKVLFKRVDNSPRDARLIIVNNDKDLSDREYVVEFHALACAPHLGLLASIDLGQVKLGEPKEASIPIRNTGVCPLLLSGFLWSGAEGFTLVVDTNEYPTNGGEQMIQFDPPVAIDSNSQIEWKVRYDPPSGAPATAKVTIFAINDPEATEGRTVEILANTTGPCIRVAPSPVEFGAKLIQTTTTIPVQINSCGTENLIVTDIHLESGEDLSQDFSLDETTLPTGKLPSQEEPLIIEPGQSAAIGVRYTPDVQNPVDPVTQQPILDRGLLVIVNNTFMPEVKVEISGYGVPSECPIPVITIEEGEEVPPQTILHLHGDQSMAANGTITKYQWSVFQPKENLFDLLPSYSEKNVTHEVNVAGEYTYCLDVCDNAYCSYDPSCKTTACKKVVVIPTEALHCELTWRTPADKNEYDEGPDAGSDMDLHFIHPYAGGPDLDGDGLPDGWFDTSYDCFWYTCKEKCLEWESQNPNIPDNPCLDRDDTDGAGPENINLDVPVNGRTYKVGVHYWDDHGFGVSYPMVKCYCWGQLAFQMDLYEKGIPMTTCDMWEVATISWPDCKITAIQAADGGPKIIHHYQHPAFTKIGVDLCGQ